MLPFADNNYNPGISLTRPITYKGALLGFSSIAFEHESNDKDSLDNRSCNYFVLSGVYFFNDLFSTQLKVWGRWLSRVKKGYFMNSFAGITMNEWLFIIFILLFITIIDVFTARYLTHGYLFKKEELKAKTN